MSAKLETFFELKQVVDHDCGNYRIGEIDFVDYGAIEKYVERHGKFGYDELITVCTRIMYDAQHQLRKQRIESSNGAAYGPAL